MSRARKSGRTRDRARSCSVDTPVHTITHTQRKATPQAVHLVVPAPSRSADLRRVPERTSIERMPEFLASCTARTHAHEQHKTR
jgi:hypothetical protein